MAMSAARQAQRIKTTYLKHKTLHDPVCTMEEGPATTGGAAEEAIADEESRTESESDGAPDAPSGSAPALCRKRPNPWKLVFEKFGSGKTDDAIKALIESRDTFLDSHAREHDVLDCPFGEPSLRFHGFHYKEKPQRERRSIILNCPFRYRAKCLFQIKVQLSTCQLKIWEKGEHDHSKDISKTIPVAAAKKIKETVKLAPVGQRASKLYKELNRSSATRVSPTISKVRAVQRLVRRTSGDKVIVLHGIHLDNTYGSVRQVRFMHCNFNANFAQFYILLLKGFNHMLKDLVPCAVSVCWFCSEVRSVCDFPQIVKLLARRTLPMSFGGDTAQSDTLDWRDR